MEFPSFNHHHHHHHHRYVPPPPPKFSEGHPNLYPHHLPPPPLLPSPHPPSYPSLPPPRLPPPPPPPAPYNPHQSHFTFLDSQNPSFFIDRRSSPPPPPPRFSDQSHRFNYRPDPWSDPPRILPELPHSDRIVQDDDLHRRPFSPYPASESFYKPHDLECVIPSSRYTDDIMIDSYASRDGSNIVKQEQQLLSHGGRNDNDGNNKYHRHRHDLDRYESANSERISSDLGFSCCSSRNQKDFVDKFEVHYTSMLENERSRGTHIDKDQRWDHGMEVEKNEFVRGGDVGVSFGSARGESRGYEYDLGKFNREREGREEYKQVQKKSVLLRIGKPKNSYRNRSHDQNFSRTYLDESDNNNFRGKDKYKDHSNKDFSLHKDQKLEGDRERSPVDLDVSFKSNALVAKAVVAPSSLAFDDSCTPPRNRKIRRATEFHSPVVKFREHSTRSESSSHGSECPSSSEKAPRKLREQGSSSAVNDSARNGMDESLSGIVLDQGCGSGGSDGPLSFKLTNKRKVINLGSRASIYHPTKKDDERLIGERSDSLSAPNRVAISFPSLEESIVEVANGSPQSIVSKKDGSEHDTVGPCQFDNERNVVALSSPLADKIDPSLHDISSLVLDPNADKTLTELKVSTVCDDLNQRPCQNEVSPFHEDDTLKGSTDDKVSLRGSDISVSSRQEEIEIHKFPAESYAAVNTTNTCFSSCNVSTKKQETSIISDTSSLDRGLDEIITVLPENDAVQGSLKDVSTKEEGTKSLEGITSAPNSCFTAAQVKKAISESSDVGDTTKQLCLDEASISCGDGLDGSPNAVIVAGANPSDGCVKSYSPDAKRKRKSSEIQFGLASPSKIPKNVVNPVLDGDANPSSSLNKSSFHEDEVKEVGKLLSAVVQTSGQDHGNPSPDDGSYLLQTDDMPPSSIISACADGNVTLNDKSVESIPDMLSGIVSSQKVSSFSGSCKLTSKSTDQMISSQDNPRNDDYVPEKSVSKGDALLSYPLPFVDNSTTSVEMSHSKVTDHVACPKIAPSASKGSNVKTQSLNTKLLGPNLTMKQPSSSAVPRVFAGRSSSVFTNSRINSPANHIAKPRTWRRSTSNPASPPLAVTKSSSVPVPPPPRRVGMGQNSYVRSGNSLVRKSAPVTAIANGSPASSLSISPLNPSVTNEITNSAGSGSKMHNTYSGTGGSSAPVVRPKTPPLSGSTKLSDCSTIYTGDLPSSPLEHLPINAVETVAPLEGNFAAPKVTEYPEDQTGKPSKLKSQKTLDEGTTGKEMRYVKRKSNQLVAASSTDRSVQDLGQTQASSSDGYYKRRKNQLIRTSVGDNSVNTEVQKALKLNVKRQTAKGTSKKYKHSRFSSVWTLDSQSSRKNGVALRHKLIPHLFPWKRASDWANVMNSSAFVPSNNSSSSISRKLLLSRKREMIYKRSSHGLSLRMSKLLSVGGASLKWSKSIERNSKRANEEATLAVAAAEKKKREQHGTVAATDEIKRRENMSSKLIHSKKLLPEDRIFRIGLGRYKMDPSKRSLQRISDEEPSTSVQSNKETKRSYVPKRLLIGLEEYVRVGNGNQLVRNPKRRTRIFANEKVRWSLHTARSRLAKKRKYCQFFTRFGRCNKDDGKCPYIHDSSKIAVCTKFLNGSCSSPNCKLTHKVIPERMQDCSYFLQGLCSNEHCPYRHVNVNSAASVCEGFLKGYCADGNECRKKHTYTCSIFEATGVCPQGSKCKLHHPKNRNKGLKRKQQQSKEQHQKNTRGRYFGSIRAADCAMPVSEKPYSKNDSDMFCEEGKFAEYIGLDFSDEEAGDTGEQRTMLSSDPSDFGAAEFEELTKPIGIINQYRVAESALGFDSPSEPTASSFSADNTDC